MDSNAILKQLLKAFLGDCLFKVDRTKKVIEITIKGETNVLTFEQCIDYLDNVINGKG